MVFLAADYSQLEARILAYLSGDAVSIRAFDEGRDIHNQNAMDLFEYLLEHWEELAPLERTLCRNFAKTFLYGISYGGATETIKMKTYCPCPKCIHLVPDTLNMSKQRLKEVEVAWFTKHKAVAEFHAALKYQVEEHQFWDCPFGGRRQFFAPWSPELDRETKNAPMQTTAAALMNRKQVELDRLNAPIVLQKHDEFMFEIRKEDINKYADMSHEVMEASYPDVGVLSDISFPIDVEVGDTWGSLEKMAA
jgi:DNA polymerase-1